MKKIGVVTWLGGGNYGTSLQSYALNEKLRNLGYDAYQIVHFEINNNSLIKRLYKELVFSLQLDVAKKVLHKHSLPLRLQKLMQFEKESYKLLRVFSNRSLHKALKNIDVFCCGSDQIWNTVYRFDEFMFLNFAKDKKRISYASSIGIEQIPIEHKERVRELLKKFAHIAVREETAVRTLKDLLPSKEIVNVLDPTFLLNSEDWHKMSRNAIIEIELPQNYLLCYFVGERPEYINQLQNVTKQTGIKDIVFVSFTGKDCKLPNVISYKDAGPREFVHLIEKAKFVCTDSFHATAISINFRKDFVEFKRFDDTDQKSQNSRIYDLLSHYGLMGRIYDDKNPVWTSTIDYSVVNEILSDDRRKSTEYLMKAIEE